ncbi:AAA domain-containing protein [Amycolatopsis mongoliensis]|uniref:AAA domain-containing protein n=1 Tax=Amycolatopsis mongoliensis TaxID=715475 RepID=A0A9Y2NFZ3_9PSEU|nr:AAA domain-containing protein [Amycolatopsis sp. 4-36]WIY04261.1 AAA domain-containing protein [Amycolatopsis sp. 4-36]
MTAQLDTGRIDAVAVKAAEWRRNLIDLSFRNTLLYFKNTKQGCLDLTAAEPAALGELVAGGKVRLSKLVPEPDKLRDACGRAKSLGKRIQLFEEEQGVDVGHVAFGLVRTVSGQRRGAVPVPPLRAPLLLRPVVVKARTTSESDYTLELTDEPELNPVLLHALNEQHGVDSEGLADRLAQVIDGTSDHTTQMERAHARLAEVAAVHGIELQLEQAVVVGTFNYEKLPMVEDLANATELLASHDLVAAMAGFIPAHESLAGEFRPPAVDSVRPADEFLVQDADSSQHRAIMTALSGRHVFIEGPPGTGKSQTIANIIAGAAATGKKVLFVAEKRAAIEAVLNRLAAVELDGLMFDLHQRKINKREVAQQLASSLDRMAKEPPVGVEALHGRLVAARQRLLDHTRELHTRRQPWGVSAYEVRSRLLDLPPGGDIRGAFRGNHLRALDAAVVTELEQTIQEFVEAGGLRILRRETPWCNTQVRTPDEAEAVLVQLDQVANQTLKRSQHGMYRLVARVGLRQPQDFAGWDHVLQLLDGVSRSVQAFGPAIFGTQLDDFVQATADRSTRARYSRKLSWGRRRALVNQLRTMSSAGLTKKRDLHAALAAVTGQRQRWRELGGQDVAPAEIIGLDQVVHEYGEMRRQLAAVALSARWPELDSGPAPEVEQRLAALADDKDMLFLMPRLNALLDRFRQIGLDPLLTEIAGKNLRPDDAWRAFERIWLSSIEDDFKLRIPALGQFVAERHSRTAADFREADREHFTTAARRVRRQVARRAREAQDTYPDQAQILKKQASLKTRHMPTRKLVEKTSDVLLSLRPCWAMSPLVVSRMLPAERLFDLVIFDEASQIRPHDAITSIMRGERLVVAGDEKQLPPSNFFDRAIAVDDEDDEDDGDLSDYESILTALRPIMPATEMLRWHYRSTDERLIAFSNREIYRNNLVTFPGAQRDTPVTLVTVAGEASPGQNGSAPAEVDRVVELIMEHARTRPGESLGVITPGVKHQARVEQRLNQARREHPDLDEFFSDEEELGRRFFVKNLESVQGDERDAIILTVGVARTAAGKINRTAFGILNRKDSERRVNVAVTRAKRRMTVVASFTHSDLAPSDEVTGTELLRRYLDFATHLQIDHVGRPDDLPLNGFERSIRDALVERGVPVHPQWGFSGYRIDFALEHRDQPGRMVLAVEADGDRYHRSHSARDRDRLRQAHLENLGWRFHRVWSSAWFANPAQEVDNIVVAWHQAMAEADAVAAVVPERTPPPRPADPPPASVRGPRPRVPAGLAIQEYSERQLIEICRWHMSDGLLLDRDERLRQVMAELGFQRRGPRIVAALGRAIEIAQRLADKEEN